MAADDNKAADDGAEPVAAPAASDPFMMVPAEIPARALTAISRNFRLVEALQSVVAAGLKQQQIHAVDAGRLVASLTKANDSLARLHGLFEPRAANEAQTKIDPKSPVAQAAARKLMSLLDGEATEAEVIDVTPVPEAAPAPTRASARPPIAEPARKAAPPRERAPSAAPSPAMARRPGRTAPPRGLQ